MPTGYTSKLYEGEPQTFAEFALDCARAFLIQMKESNAQIPEVFEPHTWHRDGLEQAQARLAELQGMTPSEVSSRAQQARVEFERERAEARAQREGVRDRCTAMLEEVEDWEPPTERHRDLKEFMLDQLRKTIDFDGRPLSPSTWMPPAVGEEWRSAEIQIALRDIAYHSKEWANDQERATDATEWIRKLRDSLRELSLIP